MKKCFILFSAVAAICLTVAGTMLTSCDKLEDLDGMNDSSALYSYRSFTTAFDYQDAAGPFDTAIRFSVGMEPIRGGADNEVIEACDACYENLKQKLEGKSGKVAILKTRHPDGKQKVLKEYEF